MAYSVTAESRLWFPLRSVFLASVLNPAVEKLEQSHSMLLNLRHLPIDGASFLVEKPVLSKNA